MLTSSTTKRVKLLQGPTFCGPDIKYYKPVVQ